MANLDKIRNLEAVKVDLGGKNRTIQFDLNSFAVLEKRFGSVNAAMAAFNTGEMKHLRTILWAGLIHEEAILDEDGEPTGYNITPFQVGSWIHPNSIAEISLKITQAMGADLPTLEANPDVQAELARNGMTLKDGEIIAIVEQTAEEKLAQEQERKNG